MSSTFRFRRRTVALTVALVAAAVLTVLSRPHPASASEASGCRTSNPLLPLVHHEPGRYVHAFASLNATNNRGLWAGTRFDGNGTFEVITWRAGHTTVLDSISFLSEAFSYTESVRVVGVTARGDVVISAQSPSGHNPNVRVGYRYSGGRRYLLSRRPGWVSFYPTAVSPDGRIAGVAGLIRSQQAIQWVGSGAGTVSVEDTGRAVQTTMDQYGDLLWTTITNGHSQISARTPPGRVIRLVGPAGGEAAASIAAGRFLWGATVGERRLLRWDLATVRSQPSLTTLAPALVGSSTFSDSVTASTNGSYVAEYVDAHSTVRFTFIDAWGDRHSLPATFDEPGRSGSRLFGSDVSGAVALTTTDGNVRLYQCSLNPAGHVPVGRLYGSSVSGNSITITGGGFDPDAPTTPLIVTLYDQSRGRTLVGQYVANQVSTAPGAVWYRLARRSFIATFPAATGQHTYCAYGGNLGYGRVAGLLGCLHVVV